MNRRGFLQTLYNGVAIVAIATRIPKELLHPPVFVESDKLALIRNLLANGIQAHYDMMAQTCYSTGTSGAE